jgi:hypothetical protein
LDNLIGKQGLLKSQLGEHRFTFLSVSAEPQPRAEVSEETFESTISRSSFEVLFDPGTLVDGGNTKVISGFYISRIL